MRASTMPTAWRKSDATKRLRTDFPPSSGQARPVKTRPGSTGKDFLRAKELRSEKPPITSQRTPTLGASLIQHPWGTTQRNVSQGGGVFPLCRAMGKTFHGFGVRSPVDRVRKCFRATPNQFPWRMADAGENNQANQERKQK